MNMNSKNQSKIRILQGEERLGAAARSSAFMAAEDFAPGAEPILTIKEVGFGSCTLDAGRKEDHDVIFFAENSGNGLPVVRPLICNSTNRKTLYSLYGDLSASALEGKRIRLYIDPRVRAVGGGTTSGIRIRKMIPEAPAQQMPSQPIPGNPAPSAICSQCGRPVTAVSNGSYEEVLQYGLRCWGRELCAECQSVLMQAGQAQSCN